jgi:hypothetical protein
MTDPEGSKHIYMLYVGAGWAYARLPFSIEKKLKNFDPLLRWLVIDGYGFHQAYFKTKKYVFKKQLPSRLKNSYSLKVFYQGVGRCLWFIECATPELIAKRIAGFPDSYQPELWAGVGLACAYAGGATEKDIKYLKELSSPHTLHLAQGTVFAATAREKANIVSGENELVCQLICALSVKEASLLADRCLAQVPCELSSANKYEWWREAIRKSLTKVTRHETVV